MRRLAVAILVVIMSCTLATPSARGRALARLETGHRSGERCCHVYCVSGEDVSTVHLKEAGSCADCRSVVICIDSGKSRPAVCIVVIRDSPTADRLCGHGPAWVSPQRQQPGCIHRCRQEPAWVHKGRRLLENIRYLLGL